jgi:TolB-like protein
MGTVYAARDERLERVVALKTMSSLRGDETARKRFWREAKAAASVNHPNICQLYEIGEEKGELFITMELLEGESLAARLERGPMPVAETVPIGLDILSALSTLHGHGIVHRDLKPSNVFLTPHGVKLVDFGLARVLESNLGTALDSADLTAPGLLLGTPRYMAPEQVKGDAANARSDLFAVGVILFEMLAGRPAFAGRNFVEILHATLHEQPPALTGSPAVAAVDRVIRHALSKNPSERPPSADSMALELRSIRGVAGEGETPVLARTLTRLVVLPFRILRPDPETDFLAFSLADAIATSLTRFGSLIVRSSAVAARFGSEAPDLKAVAAEADVDRVVLGTVLRSGDQLRTTSQLVEAPSGTLLTSLEILSSLGDLFRLQDNIARRVVGALSIPLSGAASPTPDEPRDARAYALYLQANELTRRYDTVPRARELYQQSIELDPSFAPAWAQLARCYRIIGKYIGGIPDTAARAEEALRRALELNPRLTVAHKLYANLEDDTGHSLDALVRLLREAGHQGNDPELFAGLVHACRYCGLYEQSIAAHREARRLDPNVPTSVEQTIKMTGDIERLLAFEAQGRTGGDEVIRAVGLGLAGRRDEARTALSRMDLAPRITAFQPWIEFLMAWLDRRPADMVAHRAKLAGFDIMEDPEAIFQEGWLYCDAGDPERGLGLLRRAVARGYFVATTLAETPSLAAVREEPVFREILGQAQAGRERALTAFRENDGERLVGYAPN